MIAEWLALVFLLALAGGLVALFLRPDPAEAMLVAQLLGTVGVGLLLVLDGTRSAIWVALTLALLAGVAGVTFVQRHSADGEGDR